MKQPTELVVAHLSDHLSDLAEYLIDIGYDLVHDDCGWPDECPRGIVCDGELVVPDEVAWASQLRDGSIGIITIGDAAVYQGALLIEANHVFDETPSPSELATALALVIQVAQVHEELTREREETQRWADLALHDSLTSLPNRRAWDDRFAQELASRNPIAIAIVDLDNFKQINDRAGHDIGDEVLRNAAHSMRRCLRETDFVARIGGDEFAVIVQHVNQSQTCQILIRLRDEVAKGLAARKLPRVLMSAGVSLVGAEEPRSATEIVRDAAMSLQAAKQRSRKLAVKSLPAPSPSKKDARP